MDPETLRAEIRRLGPWHHDFELAPGVWTGAPQPPGTYPDSVGEPVLIRPDVSLGRVASQVWPDGLQGRSFLDCACNAGGYLFAAKALGASRGFGFDVRDHWIDQARFLARHLPSDGIDLRVMDLMELPSLDLPRFDITWFSGIFYHLADPIAGLRAACDRTSELIVVNTQTKPIPVPALVLKIEGRDAVMSGVHGLAWAPSNDHVLSEILAWCGFPHSRLRFDRPVGEGRRRIQLLAAREEKAFEHYDKVMPRRPPAPKRSLLRRLVGRARRPFS